MMKTASFEQFSFKGEVEMEEKIVGVSPDIQHIKDLIERVANTDLNVIITGDSGVGKELVARQLYLKSPRNGKPFVKINCAALPETLLESELFGHVRGAFTGAYQKKRGKFEVAHRGVLFLDEIGDMSLSLQSKLLHVLQGGGFSPVGAEKDVKTDTWVIAATNSNLEQAVSKNKFRQDLYHRLNIIKIFIPALCKRPEDIPPLVRYFVHQYAPQFPNNSFITERHIERLAQYTWPGNVRELQNVLKRILVLGDCNQVIDELLASSTFSEETPSFQAAAWTVRDLLQFQDEQEQSLSSFSLKKIKKKMVDRLEREVISTVLSKTGWNRSNASKILKISYKALLYKIIELKIEPPVRPDNHVSS